MKKFWLYYFSIVNIFFILSVTNCSVISDVKEKTSAVVYDSSDDSLVVEPQPFSNSTEAVLLEEDDDLYEDDAPVRYDGAQLWRISYDDQDKRNKVAELQDYFGVEMWSLNQNHTSVDILIKKPIIDGVHQFLDESKVPYNIIIADLQTAIENENPPKAEIEELQNRKAKKTRFSRSINYYRMPRSYYNARNYQKKLYYHRLRSIYLGYNSLDPPLELWPKTYWGHRMTWRAYHRVIDIHGYLDYLANTYKNLISVLSIGNSVEGRPLKVLRISNGNPNNYAIWMDGGIHAREWISPAVVTYIIDHFAEQWEDQPDYIQNIDWYILPVSNPDGYEYTHEYDRLWRKNRGGPGSGRCAGVDLNRNYGYRWGGEGASRQPCAETFAGSGAFSEPETRAVRDFMQSIRSKIGAFLTFHSYGQYILYPWGYDRSVPPDYQDLDRVAKESAKIIHEKYGTAYTVGPSGSLLYPASGASDDWAKGALGIKYTYTVELPDSGRHGFILPASMIETTAKQTLHIVNAVAKAVSLI